MLLPMSPPFFIIIITIIQISLFIYYDQLAKKQQETVTSLLIKSPFIFDPSKRHQLWRYISYALVHIDWIHLTCNISIQIIIGLPLELNHKYRIVIVYLLGCLSGSLCSYLIDYNRILLGSSAAVCAIVFAFFAYCCFVSIYFISKDGNSQEEWVWTQWVTQLKTHNFWVE